MFIPSIAYIPYQPVVYFYAGVGSAVNTFFVIRISAAFIYFIVHAAFVRIKLEMMTTTVLPLRLAASCKGLMECNDGCAVTKQGGEGTGRLTAGRAEPGAMEGHSEQWHRQQTR